ncbi:MAG: NYN domain-containing protein [Parachlamydiaceae bacterium]|nr:NYN domain-containing protein [Parachlamydiaceae bacterium]
MHYYIDGYNLIFRSLGVSDDFTQKRQQFIEDLNAIAKLLDLEMTLVFDSCYQVGEGTRSHYNHLEILYSGQGEIADTLILERVQEERFPNRVTVVTSDKKLAWFARRCSAKTEAAEAFMGSIKRRCLNRLKPKPVKVKPKSVPKIAPQPEAPVEECFEYYLKQFEEKLKTEPPLPRPKSQPTKRKSRKIKQAPENVLSDMERWLRAFEEGGNRDERD